MELQLRGKISAGQVALDTAISDLRYVNGPNGPVLVSVSGPAGGLATFRLREDLLPQRGDQVHYNTGQVSGAGHDLLVTDSGGAIRVYATGFSQDGILRYTLGTGGDLGGRAILGGADIGAAPAVAAITEGGDILLADPGQSGFSVHAMGGSALGQGYTVADTSATHADAISAAAATRIAGTDIVVVASQSEHGVTAYTIGASSARAGDSVGPAQGLGIMVPTDIAIVTTAQGSFVIVASEPSNGESGALSVMQLDAQGGLTPTDHVLDTRESRFCNVQKVATLTHDGHTYVVAAGGDGGVTLFEMTPDGRLVHIDSFEGTLQAPLGDVTALEFAVVGDELQVFAATEEDTGIAVLRADLSQQGIVLVADNGNDTLTGTGQNDILFDGTGTDRLEGRGGADRYVFTADGQTDTVIGFNPAQDILDLSGLPFLYDVSRLEIVSTSYGARITHRGETIILRSANGQPLDPEAVRAAVEVKINRSFSAPTLDLEGTDGPDMLRGDWGSDTIVGGHGNDTLEGQDGADSLIGGRGDDSIMGMGGSDNLRGGRGRDRLFGGEGDDTIQGGSDDDRLVGHSGNDRMYGQGDNDTLSGSQGNDTLHGDLGDDRLDGGADDDRLDGGDGADTLLGSSGNDTMDGGEFHDAIHGGTGNDVALGDRGHDTIHGDEGNDTLLGDPGNDHLYGGAGHDHLAGDIGHDTLWGEDGRDTLVGGSGRDSFYGGADADSLIGGAGDDRLRGQDGNDTLQGDDGNDTMTGNRGDDRLDGGAGTDVLYGGGGNDRLEGGRDADRLEGSHGQDTLSGGHGHDEITGGRDNDLLTGARGNDTMTGDHGRDELRGGSGNDVMNGGTSSDQLHGGTGHDVMNGDEGHDRINGNRGNDRIDGAIGRDTISGGHGDDLIRGGADADYLNGNSGDDTLTGGTGADTFVFRPGGDADVITDFDPAEDRLQLDSGWRDAGMSKSAFVTAYARDTPDGIVLDMGNGDTILLEDFHNLNRLDDALIFG
ncbi:calcium-binding protein [Roseovarius sp.]|uniref:calcium-binding protein n=1 Tax=Roseovarius sp. TaxID=1486281 RepID=UPI0026289AB7|nr:calcium-binding protein [Roseovarius sp.]MDM8166148.1 calcium-binding protein [Roseovarius sp.]